MKNTFNELLDEVVHLVNCPKNARIRKDSTYLKDLMSRLQTYVFDSSNDENDRELMMYQHGYVLTILNSALDVEFAAGGKYDKKHGLVRR